jgi:sialidase-1
MLHYDTLNNPSPGSHGQDMQIWSSDDGLTWHSSQVLSYPPQQNLGALIGPSVGLQAASGITYFSADQVGGGGHFLYWSDDLGASWKSSERIPLSGECSIAFLVNPADGRILMNCRTGQRRRAQIVWSPNGTAGTLSWPVELVEPGGGCQGSIINDGGVLFFSNPNTNITRSNMTVKRSTDQGQSWDSGVLVWEGPSGYSQLVSVGVQGTVGLFFESSATNFGKEYVLSYVNVSVGMTAELDSGQRATNADEPATVPTSV